MRKNINLLPKELRYGFVKRLIVYQEAHPKKFVLAGLGLLSALALTVSASQSLPTKNYIRKALFTETRLREVQAKEKEAQGVMNQVLQAKALLQFQAALLNNRLAFLKAQYNFGHHWAVILKELARLVPKGVWLTAFKNEDYYLKIAGGAGEEDLVSDFMSQLRGSPLFNNVSFIYTQDSKVGKSRVVLFELTCNYSAQAPEAQ